MRTLSLLALLAIARTAPAQPQSIAPGVTYEASHDARGPWTLHVLRVDLARARVTAGRAHDALRGRERTSAIAARASAVAAVNADFFDLRTGENENEQIVAGEWWKGLEVTDSPYDTYDNVHAQLAIDAAGHASIARYQLDARAWAGSVAALGMPILAVNARVLGTYEGTMLFTPRFGAATPRDSAARSTQPKDMDAARDTTRPTAEAPLANAGHRGDTLLFVRRGATSSTTGTPIPSDGAVLSAYGPRAAVVQALRDGDTVKVRLTVRPAVARPTETLLGGWPQILRGGVNVASDAPIVEGTISRNAEVRHPRTAVGVTRDGRHLIIAVVDGRSAQSVGMTLVELAAAMKSLGAYDALNFDGGGSSTMVVNGRVVNAPSDPTGEREVGSALLVLGRDTRRAP